MKLENMTAQQIERARACQTAEQLEAFIADEAVELTDEQLEFVTGGTGFVQRFKQVFGPFLYPPCPEGGHHEFVDYAGVDELTLAHDKVRCTKCGAIY